MDGQQRLVLMTRCKALIPWGEQNLNWDTRKARISRGSIFCLAITNWNAQSAIWALKSMMR